MEKTKKEMKCGMKDCSKEAITGMLIVKDDGGFGYCSIFGVCEEHRDELRKMPYAQEQKEWFERHRK